MTALHFRTRRNFEKIFDLFSLQAQVHVRFLRTEGTVLKRYCIVLFATNASPPPLT